MTPVLLENQEEIIQWLYKHNAAFVRYCGNDLKGMIQHFFFRIAAWVNISVDLAALTHYSQGKMMYCDNLPFVGRYCHLGGSVYVNEPYYSIQFKDSDNNVTTIKYPDEEAFEKERQYYSTPTALNVSFCLERLKNPFPPTAFPKENDEYSWINEFFKFVKPFWAGTKEAFSDWSRDFIAGTIGTGYGFDPFYEEVIRDFKFNPSVPFPKCRFKKEKIIFDKITPIRRYLSGKEPYTCFFEELLFSRVPKRHLIIPLRLIYFNEGHNGALWRIYKNNFMPDFMETRPEKGRTDYLFSTNKTVETARSCWLEIKKEHGINRLYFYQEPIAEFDGIFSCPEK